MAQSSRKLFARIEREVIARGVFTSVEDLARKLMRYIRHYNRAPKPIKWTYRDPSHRISADTISAVTATSQETNAENTSARPFLSPH